jgi:hypothetical protein
LLCPFLAKWFLPIRFLLIVSNFQFFLLNFSVFTAGMPRGYLNVCYDFIVTAHHGSRHAILTDSVAAAQNARVVISVGSNKYKHPAPEHIAKLTKMVLK